MFQEVYCTPPPNFSGSTPPPPPHRNFWSYSGHKREVIVPGVPCGDRGNWDQASLRDESHACFAKKANERLNLKLFRNVSVHDFYRLKALITLEQFNTTEWSKKNKDGRVLWTFTVCQWVLWGARDFFPAIIEIKYSVDHFFDIWQWCIFSGIEALEFSCTYARV